MKTQKILIGLLIVALTAPLAMASQREPAEVWRSFAEKLEAGAFVRVRLVGHREVKGYVVMVDGDILRLKPKLECPFLFAICSSPISNRSIVRKKAGVPEKRFSLE